MITGNEPIMPTTGSNYPISEVTKTSSLTIRQHFAAMAMQGLMASLEAGLYSNGDCHAQKYASDCVVMADALIAELNKKQ